MAIPTAPETPVEMRQAHPASSPSVISLSSSSPPARPAVRRPPPANNAPSQQLHYGKPSHATPSQLSRAHAPNRGNGDPAVKVVRNRIVTDPERSRFGMREPVSLSSDSEDGSPPPPSYSMVNGEMPPIHQQLNNINNYFGDDRAVPVQSLSRVPPPDYRGAAPVKPNEAVRIPPRPLEDHHQPRAPHDQVQVARPANAYPSGLYPGIPPPTGIARTLNVGPTRKFTPPLQQQGPPRPPAVPIAMPSGPPLAPRPYPFEQNYVADVGRSMYANDEDEGPVLSPAEAQKALQELLSSSIGDAEIEGVDMEKDSKVEGFRDSITLMPHQVKGRMWMRGREEGKSRGGILADDMGLGKTIQTLTRIVDGKITDTDRKAGYTRPTLIVCPVGLIKQWGSEIQKMTIGLRVVEHHGGGRTKDPKVLERADVVITSYSVVSSEHGAFLGPEAEKPKKKSKKKDDFIDDDSDEEFTKTIKKPKKRSASPLFEINFLRIVLDEAHNIKNKTAKQSVACCELDGKYKWCLTGTPIQNNVEDLFPLFKFLGVKPLNEWSEFKRVIAAPVKAGRSVRAMKRLQVIFKAIMLRRTKDQQVNGAPLLKLPPREVTVVPCPFDDDELAFYKALEERTTLTFNKYLKAGEVMSNYTSVLLLLLRMRQACDHPGLISKDFNQEVAAIEPNADRSEKQEEAVTQQEEDELADLLGKMGVSDNVMRCTICLEELPKERKQTVCTSCDSQGIAATSRRKSLANFPQNEDEEVEDVPAIPRNEVAFPKKSSKSASGLPPSSAKIRKIIELLSDIDERSDGDEKTIIFSQFTGMLDLIEPFLKANGIRFVRLDGSMVPKAREDSLNKIKTNKNIPVILISFKAGGTGLNLVCCNNVILVDLWWNPALEDQAFDRAHRLGQTRAVNIYKLVIEQTVEDRILTLQDSKRDLAKAALSGAKLSATKLGMEDLLALFRTDGAHGEDDGDSDSD